MLDLALHTSECEAAVFQLPGCLDHLGLNCFNTVVCNFQSSIERVHCLLHLLIVLAVTLNQPERLLVLLCQIVQAGEGGCVVCGDLLFEGLLFLV